MENTTPEHLHDESDIEEEACPHCRFEQLVQSMVDEQMTALQEAHNAWLRDDEAPENGPLFVELAKAAASIHMLRNYHHVNVRECVDSDNPEVGSIYAFDEGRLVAIGCLIQTLVGSI